MYTRTPPPPTHTHTNLHVYTTPTHTYYTCMYTPSPPPHTHKLTCIHPPTHSNVHVMMYTLLTHPHKLTHDVPPPPPPTHTHTLQLVSQTIPASTLNYQWKGNYQVMVLNLTNQPFPQLSASVSDRRVAIRVEPLDQWSDKIVGPWWVIPNSQS